MSDPRRRSIRPTQPAAAAEPAPAAPPPADQVAQEAPPPAAEAPAAAPPPPPPPPAPAMPLVTPNVFVPPDQPVVIDLLSKLVNSQRQPGQKFILVVLPESDNPRIEEHDTVEKLIAAIRGYDKTDCSVFAMLGHRLPITKRPFRFLKTPFGGNIPLFDPTGVDAEEDHGWMGKDPLPDPTMGIPQTPPDDEPEEEVQARQQPPQQVVAPAITVPDDTPPFDNAPPDTGA